jgi:hypothetical protein
VSLRIVLVVHVLDSERALRTLHEPVPDLHTLDLRRLAARHDRLDPLRVLLGLNFDRAQPSQRLAQVAPVLLLGLVQGHRLHEQSAVEHGLEPSRVHVREGRHGPVVVADQQPAAAPCVRLSGVDRGLDLIEILDTKQVVRASNLWSAGTPLEDGTHLARLMIRGDVRQVLGVRTDAPIGFASGEVGAARTTYTDMIERVRGITDKAVVLIDK